MKTFLQRGQRLFRATQRPSPAAVFESRMACPLRALQVALLGAITLSSVACTSGPGEAKRMEKSLGNNSTNRAAATIPPPPSPQESLHFDGDQAWQDLESIVAMGARPSQSPGLAELRKYLSKELRAVGLTPIEEAFENEVPITPNTLEGKLRFVNLYADLEGSAGLESPFVIVATHMDTKFLPNFVGANDAGSSTAVVLELARAFARAPERPVSYRFVFFDGEEAVRTYWEDPDNTYGSRHHALHLAQSAEFHRLSAFVLLDMVADKDLQLTTDLYSTPWLQEIFVEEAKSAGYAQHVEGPANWVSDDHLPFLALRVPSVNLIDFEYGPDNRFWHTSDDVLANCSRDSIEVIGQIACLGLLRLERQLAPAPTRR